MNSMNFFISETILAFTLTVIGVMILKKKNYLSEKDVAPFTNLLIQFVIPANIILMLMNKNVSKVQLEMGAILFISSFLALILAYVVGRIFKLKRSYIGALIMTSAFSASGLLGYPLIKILFPGNAMAIADAIMMTEIGVGLPTLIFCPIVARYFGEQAGFHTNKHIIMSALKDYFCSPIFISIIVGIVLAFSGIGSNQDFVADMLRSGLNISASGLTILPAVIIGLRLKKIAIGHILPLIVASAAIQMFFEPYMTTYLANLISLPATEKTVLLLLSMMPSALLAPVFASRYDCAPDETSAIVFVNIILSVALVPLMYGLLF